MSDSINLAEGLTASHKPWRDLFSKKKTAQQWISVNERLPETSGEVLVTRRYAWTIGDDYDRCIDIGYYYSNLKQWDTLDLNNIEVLAWMPLPKPYEGVMPNDKP